MPLTREPKVLYAFGGSDGAYPYAGLVQGTDGSLYGTTLDGGAANDGTVFRITTAGQETVLYSFAGGTGDGYQPYAPLVQGSDGNLYGSTEHGGSYNDGVIFEVSLAGVEKVLHVFAGGNTDGANPQGALVKGSDGNFYGMTPAGGHSGDGVVFQLIP